MVGAGWNIYRDARIVVHNSILQQLWKLIRRGELPTSSLLQVQRAQSQSIISEMAFDICASVPYHLGNDMQTSAESGSCQTTYSAIFIIPSLRIAASWVGVPRSMKEYLLGRLSYIGHSLGIQQAIFLGNFANRALDAETLETMKNAGQVQEGYAKTLQMQEEFHLEI